MIPLIFSIIVITIFAFVSGAVFRNAKLRQRLVDDVGAVVSFVLTAIVALLLTMTVACGQEEITLIASNANMVPIQKAENYGNAVRVVRLTSTEIPAPVLQACYSVGRVTMQQGGGASMGSSTYLGDGIWITNRHVVEGGGNASVKTKAGEVLPARVTKIFSSADLAIVETANVDNRIRPIQVADVEPKPGMIVYPSGFDKGNMSWHVCWPAQIVEFFQDGDMVSSGLGPRKGSISGNSGGPTFTADGQLLAPLWGNSGGDTNTGSGTCIHVHPFKARYALLPWRDRMIKALLAQCGPGGCSPYGGGGGGGFSGGGPIQPPQYMIPSQPQQQQGPPPSYAPPAQPQPQVPVQPQAPSGGVAGPKGDKGDKGDPGTVTDEQIAKIIESVRKSLKEDPDMRGRDGREGERGPKGERGEIGLTGPAGPKGPKGDPGEITEAHLAIIAKLVAQDPNLKTVDIDLIVAEVIKRLPAQQQQPITFQLRENGKLIDEETYQPGQPIVLEINRLIKAKQ